MVEESMIPRIHFRLKHEPDAKAIFWFFEHKEHRGYTEVIL